MWKKEDLGLVVEAVAFILLMPLIFAESPGSAVTSCEVCHQDSACHVSPASEGVAEPPTFTCSCGDGFVGDGLTCYNRTTCDSDLLCCQSGFRWLSEHGCMDVDECSLPGETCRPPLSCENTPGSFQCLLPASGGHSDSRSIVNHCGGQECPLGQDCLSNDNVSRCSDPCQHYTILNEAWRSTSFTYGSYGSPSDPAKCDRGYGWQGWYRLYLGGESVQMPEICVDMHMCGTHAPLWLPEGHPSLEDGVVSRRVCAHWESDCCHWTFNSINVKACPGNYFVYMFTDPTNCYSAYCADVNTTVCGTCGPDETCVSEDNITWRCEKQEGVPLITELVCGMDLLQVGFLRADLEASGLNVSSAHMADSSCKGHLEKNGTVWFQVKRREGSCGTELKTNGTHAVYSNSVILEEVLLGDVTFTSSVSFPFSCSYPLDLKTSLDLAIRPIQTTEEVEVAGTGSRAKATMSLYRNNNYTDPYSMGAVILPLGAALYVGVFVEEAESERFVVVMEDCHATPTADPEDAVHFFLIQNKCPSDPHLVTVYESGESLQARFSALLFRFVGDYDSVFLHCSLIVCDQREASCSQSCPAGKSRSASHNRPLTIGPISKGQKSADQMSSSTRAAASWILNSLLVLASIIYLF
ncbi:hypothetical protein JZ751_000428 [Albula glossodonta]|uniref:ZP domain-containing protein n=1 Tax=Albula glossodonta TaxID=121402 RepID=A0A8T2PW54_9TELE|nr:hypothetical protein JZ751_000428 [Albula glossodonta]